MEYEGKKEACFGVKSRHSDNPSMDFLDTIYQKIFKNFMMWGGVEEIKEYMFLRRKKPTFDINWEK